MMSHAVFTLSSCFCVFWKTNCGLGRVLSTILLHHPIKAWKLILFGHLQISSNVPPHHPILKSLEIKLICYLFRRLLQRVKTGFSHRRQVKNLFITKIFFGLAFCFDLVRYSWSGCLLLLSSVWSAYDSSSLAKAAKTIPSKILYLLHR